MTTTPNLGLDLPANGADVDTWDTPVNGNSTILDTVLGGVTSLNATGGSGTITLTAAQYRPRIIKITGALTANVNYQLPAGVGGTWSVQNYTTGAFSVTFSSAGGGTSLVVPQGFLAGACSDGTNITDFDTSVSTPAGTTTQVQYNNAGVMAGSPNLTFDGATLTLTGTLALAGATSGSVDFIVPAVAGTGVYTLPSAVGSAGQFLTALDGAGTLGWTGAVGGVTSFSAGSTGFTPSTSTGGAIVLGGTLGVANGGTGLTAFTPGGALFAGSSSTLLTGTLPISAGGTGHNTTPNNGELLIGNGASYTLATITAGSGITITNAAGSITISAAGSSGTVTSVNASGGTTGLTFSGGPITTSGTLTMAGTLNTSHGGTGLTAFTSGGAMFATSASALTTGTLPITAGGTGATTAAGARTNLGIPSSIQPLITYAQFRNQQTNGAGSGESISATLWTQRVLNTTVVNTITGASLTGNQITLPAGTYQVSASGLSQASGAVGAYNHKLRLRNITGGTTLISGQNNAVDTATGTIQLVCLTSLHGFIVLSGTTTIELDSWVSTGCTGGTTITSGEVEVYCDVMLMKIA